MGLKLCCLGHMEEAMKNWKRYVTLICVAVALAIACLASGKANAESSTAGYTLPGGVYLNLTKDFYEALQGTGHDGKEVYGNTMMDEYLRQIAVSSKFMVQTNLQIIRQQEQIIKLLQSIRDREK